MDNARENRDTIEVRLNSLSHIVWVHPQPRFCRSVEPGTIKRDRLLAPEVVGSPRKDRCRFLSPLGIASGNTIQLQDELGSFCIRNHVDRNISVSHLVSGNPCFQNAICNAAGVVLVLANRIAEKALRHAQSEVVVHISRTQQRLQTICKTWREVIQYPVSLADAVCVHPLAGLTVIFQCFDQPANLTHEEIVWWHFVIDVLDIGIQ